MPDVDRKGRVRRIRADQWELARALRLEALAEAPGALAATLGEERELPEAAWKARAESDSRGEETVGFFGCDAAGEPRATAVGGRSGGSPPSVELAALWVAPELRGSGLSSALVEAVFGWAREMGAVEVTLDVTETGEAARGLYRRLGFRVVDGGKANCGARRDPSIRMARPL
ncbi:MAG: GNAT family N-acetyltransferase [Myxococcales bacterium]|jgi:ribosomal protein S18 acetylase RimI-like enzyme